MTTLSLAVPLLQRPQAKWFMTGVPCTEGALTLDRTASESCRDKYKGAWQVVFSWSAGAAVVHSKLETYLGKQ